MKQIKIIILLFLTSFVYNTYGSNELDSMKNCSLKYLIGNLNDDCYKDTVYGEIQGITSISPNFIIWGKQDSIACDTIKYYNYDSLNVEFTLIKYDSISKNFINLNTIDVTGDLISDFLFKYTIIDTNGQDSIYHMLVEGGNTLSRNYEIYINKDSLLLDTLNFVLPEFFNTSQLLRSYGGLQVYFLGDNYNLPQNHIQTDVQNSIIQTGKILIFPNPSKGELYLNVEKVPYSFDVLDIDGKTLLENTEINSNNYLIDISKFANGFYYIIIKNEEHVKSFKIVKSN